MLDQIFQATGFRYFKLNICGGSVPFVNVQTHPADTETADN